jgi:hypothetical protein
MGLASSRSRSEASPVRDWSRRFATLALASVACSLVTAIVSLVAFSGRCADGRAA